VWDKRGIEDSSVFQKKRKESLGVKESERKSEANFFLFGLSFRVSKLAEA